MHEMFDHVMLRCSDRGASRAFYETVLDPIGHRLSRRTVGSDVWDGFFIAQAGRDRPSRSGSTWRLLRVRARTSTGSGRRARMRAPGRRGSGAPPRVLRRLLRRFLLDPDGNSAEAVWQMAASASQVDHRPLWIRVADLDASRRFYETVAPSWGYASTGSGPSASTSARRTDPSPS